MENRIKNCINRLQISCQELSTIPYMHISLITRKNVDLILNYIKLNCSPSIEFNKEFNRELKKSRSHRLYRENSFKKRLVRRYENSENCLCECVFIKKICRKFCMCLSRFGRWLKKKLFRCNCNCDCKCNKKNDNELIIL